MKAELNIGTDAKAQLHALTGLPKHFAQPTKPSDEDGGASSLLGGGRDADYNGSNGSGAEFQKKLVTAAAAASAASATIST